MKKNDLVWGIIYTLIGLGCITVAYNTETALEGIIWGLGGVFFAVGVVGIIKYFYWNAPKRQERYKAREEHEKIEQNDELKTKIRDKAGRYSYLLGLYTAVISIIVFAVLDAVGVIENATMVEIYLGGYVVFQLIAGVVIFNRLMKKY